MQNPVFQFPMMSIDEALQFLNNDLPVKIIPGSSIRGQDFKTPLYPRTGQIYEGLYDLITSVPFETVFQRHRFNIAENVEHTELHEESVRLSLFTLAMTRLLQNCGSAEIFSLNDLMNPLTKRFLKILSALVNFYKFQSSRLEKFNEVKVDVEKQNVQFTQLKQRNDELRRRINAIKSAKAEKEPQVMELHTKIRDMKDKMKENIKSQGAMQKTISELKAGIAENNAASNQTRIEVMEAKKQGEKLSSQIVHAPERFKEDKKRMQAQFSQLKELKETRIQRRFELHKQEEGLKKREEDGDQVLKITHEIKVKDEEEKECAAKNAKLGDQIQTNDEMIKTLTAKEEKIDRLISSKQEKISKLSLQQQHKVASAKANLAQRVQQLELKQNQICELEDEKKLIHEQKKDKMKKKESVDKLHQTKMDEMKDMYSHILETLEDYNSNLAKCWTKAQSH